LFFTGSLSFASNFTAWLPVLPACPAPCFLSYAFPDAKPVSTFAGNAFIGMIAVHTPSRSVAD